MFKVGDRVRLEHRDGQVKPQVFVLERAPFGRLRLVGAWYNCDWDKNGSIALDVNTRLKRAIPLMWLKLAD
jgi:hypothetical protein